MRLNFKTIINLVTIILLLALPYYIFNGKLFLGGDDTRLLYSYPFEYFKNSSFYSWYSVSTIGINASNQYTLPFLGFWSAIDSILKNKVILSYTAFSMPLVLGLIYFQKLMGVLFPEKKSNFIEIYIGSLFYVLSPIVIFDLLFIYLTSTWLLCMFPALLYYFISYLRTSNFINVYKALILSMLFSFCFIAIPWILGLALPLILASPVLLVFSKKKDILTFIKKAFIFVVLLAISQSYWLFAFFAPYFIRDNSNFVFNVIAKSYTDTFTPTVVSTAVGTILYPILGLFHRQIAFDYEWKLKEQFIYLFDKTLFLNLIFIAVLIGGLLLFKKYFNKEGRRIYTYFLTAFIFSLFFFTVNIGPFKDLFLYMGKIPGFVMFRNFYDKFAPGYIFIYSILITAGLLAVSNELPKYRKAINILFIFVVLLNFTSVKSTVNSVLWTTKNVYRVITIPQEYLDMMNFIHNNVSSSNTILTLPYGSSLYSVIKDTNSNNVYLGVSPVKIFSGVNDISGTLSFNYDPDGQKIQDDITSRNYKDINKTLFKRNINYVFVNKNIPDQVIHSYAFDNNTVKYEDEGLIKGITSKKIKTSSNNSYILYEAKNKNSYLLSKNLYFKKINPVKYILYFKNLKSKQELKMFDSYNSNWKIYPVKYPNMSFCNNVVSSVKNTKECKEEFSLLTLDELLYFFKKPIFSNTHASKDGTTNDWLIDPSYIKKTLPNNYYTVKKDGSIDVEFILYYRPQLYFYYGIIISLLNLIACTIFLFFSSRYAKKK
ncbi:MAG TPA: hypothetical protein VHE53_00275 [Patescibacteria group bacterium]|nr:hypothetical protein [Patescibacteria group bacterium]